MSIQNDDLTAHLTRPRLRSPRAAAIAGIIFSILMSLSMVLVQGSFPADPTDFSGAWLEKNADSVSIAIAIVPIAGIAFLWFMGVARDLLGPANRKHWGRDRVSLFSLWCDGKQGSHKDQWCISPGPTTPHAF